jgi:hypothetical protein
MQGSIVGRGRPELTMEDGSVAEEKEDAERHFAPQPLRWRSRNELPN